MQTHPGVDTVLDAVGPRLRDLRHRRQMTLAAVATATGLSVSTLSRLESGHRRPTLDLLIPLAQVYGAALDDIVGAPRTGDPRIHLAPIRRHGMVFVPLTLAGAPVQAFKVVLPGHQPDRTAKRAAHGGYEWLYVLRGTIRLTIDDQVTVLTEGEAAEFDTRRPHSITSATERAAEMLTLFSPDGAHIHVAAPEPHQDA